MLSCYDIVTASIEVVRLLLEHNTNTSANKYALCLACQNGHVEVVRLFLVHKTKVDDDVESALRTACENGHVEVVRLLLEHNADVHTGIDYPLELHVRKVILELLDYS